MPDARCASKSYCTRYPDGRMDLLTRGQDRFEILDLNQEKSYLQATVEFFDDDDIAVTPVDLRDRALANYKALRELGHAEERGGRRTWTIRNSASNSRRFCPIWIFSIRCSAAGRRRAG